MHKPTSKDVLFRELHTEFKAKTLTVETVQSKFDEGAITPVQYAILMDLLDSKHLITDKEALYHFRTTYAVNIPDLNIKPILA
jgi:hypothetical protein